MVFESSMEPDFSCHFEGVTSWGCALFPKGLFRGGFGGVPHVRLRSQFLRHRTTTETWVQKARVAMSVNSWTRLERCCAVKLTSRYKEYRDSCEIKKKFHSSTGNRTPVSRVWHRWQAEIMTTRPLGIPTLSNSAWWISSLNNIYTKNSTLFSDTYEISSLNRIYTKLPIIRVLDWALRGSSFRINSTIIAI